MLYVELRQAKAQLLELLELALQGEEVVLTEGSRPVVKLVPLDPSQSDMDEPQERLAMEDVVDEPPADLEDQVQ